MAIIWPFPTKDSSQLRRIDQGQDFQVAVGTPIFAIASGTISYAHDPNGFGDPYPVLTFDAPQDGNPACYYGHNHPLVAEGARVQQGEIICRALQTPGGNASGDPGWLELGWWNVGPTGNGQAMHDALLAAPVFGAPIPTGTVTPNGRALDSTASIDPAAAVRAGYSAILRYLVGGSALTAAELAAYTAADFGVGSLWELGQYAAQNGEPQGASDGERAAAAAQAFGQPRGTAIYASTDFDPAPYLKAVVAYYRGFGAAVRKAGYLAGAYVGAAAANACLDEGVIDRVMIPGATSWADNAVPKRVDIQQAADQVAINGATYDRDTYNPSTAGLWNGRGAWPRPTVQKPEDHSMSITVADFKNPGAPAGRTRFVRLTIPPKGEPFTLQSFNGAKIAGHGDATVTQPSNGAVLGIEANPDGVHFVVTADDGGTFTYSFEP